MTKIEPEYPADAKKRGIEGVVQLEVVIDEEGRVRKVRILSAPDRALAASAAKAKVASKSRFKPGLVGKEAVAVTLRTSLPLRAGYVNRRRHCDLRCCAIGRAKAPVYPF